MVAFTSAALECAFRGAAEVAGVSWRRSRPVVRCQERPALNGLLFLQWVVAHVLDGVPHVIDGVEELLTAFLLEGRRDSPAPVAVCHERVPSVVLELSG